MLCFFFVLLFSSAIMIKNLKQFDEEIDSVKAKHSDCSEILYRGQVGSSWKIQSSLERIRTEEMDCEEYYGHIDKLKPLINPLIKNKFYRKMTCSGYPFDFDEYEEGSWSLPEMGYLAYLRHHGFPTPTIDWTESHYVALFFACEDFVKSKTTGKVFVYCQKLRSNVNGDGIPKFLKVGRYVETDKRHFVQQSQYLIPMVYEKKWKFITFERVIEDNTNSYDFVAIEIEKEAKKSIIKELRRMNINRYTMYLDEDSLIGNFADEFSL